MKAQDLIFLVIFIFLIWRKNDRWSVAFGLISLFLSIPLFAKWIFFTAERLTWYAAAFLLLALLQQIPKKK